MYCPFCGIDIPDHASMCTHCGSFINLPPQLGEGDIKRLRRKYRDKLGIKKTGFETVQQNYPDPEIIPAIYTARIIAVIFDWGLICGGAFLLMKQLQQISEIIPLVMPFGAFVYFVFFTTLIGRTPGKLLVGIRVIDRKTKHPPPIIQSIVRALSGLVSFFFLMVGFIAPLFDLRSRSWHDRLADTLVIYSR